MLDRLATVVGGRLVRRSGRDLMVVVLWCGLVFVLLRLLLGTLVVLVGIASADCVRRCRRCDEGLRYDEDGRLFLAARWCWPYGGRW